MNEVAQTIDVAQRARRRIFRRTMPFLFVLFVIAFLDRVNVSYAKLTMIDELGFTQKIYGFGAGIFFIGYFLLEIPGSLIAERWSARKWIARIMISWGLLSILTGFIHSPTQFYWARFMLGAAEAGFFPGIIVYLSHWFRQEDRAKAVALFMIALPITSIIASPRRQIVPPHAPRSNKRPCWRWNGALPSPVGLHTSIEFCPGNQIWSPMVIAS